jgi:hypothetical protein
MNIFYLHNDPVECAKQHNNKHVVKMILEYAQLLSTAQRVLDGHEVTELTATGRKIRRWKLESPLDSKLYKSTHVNHPSAIWVRQSYENYEWLWQLLEKVCYEYTYRYGKVHKVQREGLLEELYTPPTHIPTGVGFTEPTPAMPEQFIVPSSISSYKNYYIGAKQHLANWKKREIPNWYY